VEDAALGKTPVTMLEYDEDTGRASLPFAAKHLAEGFGIQFAITVTAAADPLQRPFCKAKQLLGLAQGHFTLLYGHTDILSLRA
jgi:hypothetical protein